jgi:hypothetical protein
LPSQRLPQPQPLSQLSQQLLPQEPHVSQPCEHLLNQRCPQPLSQELQVLQELPELHVLQVLQVLHESQLSQQPWWNKPLSLPRHRSKQDSSQQLSQQPLQPP